MKKKTVFIMCIIMSVLVGCEKKHEINVNISDTTISANKEKVTGNRIKMIYKDGPDKIFEIMPVYYQQDYQNTMIGDKSVAEAGNLVTTLAMICSYEESKYITPDMLISKYVQYFCENDINKDALFQCIADNYNRKVVNEPIDPEKIAKYINEDGMYVLLRIPHPSMYGSLSTYILLTGITENGDFIVRDSNYYNIKNYADFLDNGEPVYSSFAVCAAAGQTAQMYTFPLRYSETEMNDVEVVNDNE